MDGERRRKEETVDRSIKGFCYSAMGGMFWGLSGIFAKFLFLDGIDPVWLVAARLLFGGGLLVLWSILRQGRDSFRVFHSRRNRIGLGIFAIFGMLGVQLSYFMAIDASNPAVATILQYLAPVIILFYTLIRERRHAAVSEIIVLILILAGVFLLTTHGKMDGLVISGAALLWGLLSAVTAAFYMTQPKRLLEEFGSVAVVGWGMLIGSIPCLPVLIRRFDPVVLEGPDPALLAGVIILGTALGFALYLEGVRMVGPLTGSLLGSVEPLTAAVCTVVLLGQPFYRMDCIGILLILVGVTLLTAGPGMIIKKRKARG